MNLEDIKYQDIIIRYISKETTSEENIAVENWLRESDSNKEYFNEIKNIWQNNEYGQDNFNTDKAWNKVSTEIYNNSDLSSVKKLPSRRKKVVNALLRIAAIFILGMIGIWYVFQDKTELKTIVSNEIVNYKHVLSDGTVIYLNSNTIIDYPEKFTDDTRNIYLKQGEAFFEVSSDKEKPFIVNTEHAIVQVLGTTFNVKINPDNDNIEVTVESGMVLFYKKNENIRKLSEHNILNSKRKGIFTSDNKTVTKSNNNDLNYLSWQTGIVIFNETPLSEVVKILEKQYGVNFVIKDPELSKSKLSAKFDNKSIDEILNILEETFNIEIEKKGDNIELISSGS